MALPTVKFSYDRRKRGSSSKAASIDIDVSYNRRHRYFSTGVKVLPNQWNGSQIVNHPGGIAANALLQQKLKEIQNAINLIYMRGEEFTLSGIVLEKRSVEPNGNFISYVEDKIKSRSELALSTSKTQMKIVTALKEFRGTVRFGDVTKRFVRAFDEWLHKKDLKQSSVHSYHKIMKTYIAFAMEEGLIVDNPYLGVKIEKGKPSIRKFLEEGELHTIETFQSTNKTLMNVRDLFLFQCYTGLAYADMSLFNFEELRERKGKLVLQKSRQKTGTGFYVVLLKPAVEILKRHNFKLPIMSNQKYNLFLKALAAHTGLKFNLTSHCGRHTFATWCLNNGVSLDTLKEMLGHTDSSTTAIYAKLLNKTVEGAFAQLDAALG